MKRLIVMSALAMAVTLGTSASVEAGDGFSFSFGFGGHGSHFQIGVNNRHGRRAGLSAHLRRAPRVRRHRHDRVPSYRRVWVSPVYDTIIVGYDLCHRPIYRRVCVRQGYYRNEICGYVCASCGVHL